MTQNVRLAAAKTLLAVQSGRATLAAELERARRGFPDERDRGLLMELTAGTLRWRGAIDAVLAPFVSRPFGEIHEAVLAVLRIGVYELRHLTRMPAHAVVNEAVESVRLLRQGRASGFVNAILRSVQRKRDELTLPGRPTTTDRDAWITYLSTSLSHPRWLAERYFDRAGAAGAEAWCRYNNATPSVTVRVIARTNARDQETLEEELRAAGGTPSPLTPDAWRLPAGALTSLLDGSQSKTKGWPPARSTTFSTESTDSSERKRHQITPGPSNTVLGSAERITKCATGIASIQEEIARSALSTNQCCIIFLSARHSWPAIPASTDRPARSSCR